MAISILGIVLVTAGYALPASAQAPSYTVAYPFGSNSADGSDQDCQLMQASDGNIYGTSLEGGASGFGTLFRYNPSTGVETILHAFGSVSNDGEYPAAGVVEAGDGNVYGATESGGGYGHGTIYRYNLTTGVYRTVYNFGAASTDAKSPRNKMLLASDGCLYGVTPGGGANAEGTIFRYNVTMETETVLYSFGAVAHDAVTPVCTLVQASDGNLYGTSGSGGVQSDGTIFEYDTASNTESVNYSFGGVPNDGVHPVQGLTGAGGNLYGVTVGGGTQSHGAIFAYNRLSGESIVYSFGSVANDGLTPEARLYAASDGLLYGATEDGGSAYQGTLYAYNPLSSVETVLHSFGSIDNDGFFPDSAVFEAGNGSLYGLTPAGGDGQGVLYVVDIAPAIPTGLTAAPTSTQIALSWNAVPYATSYNLYRSATPGGEGGTPYRSGLTSPSFVDTSADGPGFYYEATAVNSYGESLPSTEISATTTVPTPPLSLTATAQTMSVALTWGSSSFAASYSVYDGTIDGQESTHRIAVGLTSTSYTVTGLTPGTTYYFIVRGDNVNGESIASNQASAVPLPPPVPDAPYPLTATAQPQTVSLSWSASTGATSYSVYGSTVDGQESANKIASGVVGTTYSVTGLTPGTAYYFIVRGDNAGGESVASNQASASPLPQPTAPISLTATAQIESVSLTWSASTGATSYSVYDSTVEGQESTDKIASGVTGTSYTVTGLTPGATYYFIVRGDDAAGESIASNQASATPLALPLPTAPYPLTATAQPQTVSLSWSASTGASSYSVYDSTVSGQESTHRIASGVTGTSYIVSGLTPGTTYYFIVRGDNATGESIASNEASSSPLPQPTAPAFLTATAQAGSVSLAWTASTGATSYSVYDSTVNGQESTNRIASGVVGTTYSLTGLTPGTTYYFIVRGDNAAGESIASNQASVTLQTTAAFVNGSVADAKR